jgi:predicted nucleotide-binding protein (sugar kinase/HSP70/actin superfamily)
MSNKNNPKIMVMGHPYVLYDNFLNMNIINKLRLNGFDVVTPEMMQEDLISHYSSKYHGKMFWKFSRHLIGTSLYLIDKKFVEGVIYISSFGCGIDSVVAETVERHIRRSGDIPYMLITIDEHSGEAGFNTRLEAYIDMLKWRLGHESNVSAHG